MMTCDVVDGMRGRLAIRVIIRASAVGCVACCYGREQFRCLIISERLYTCPWRCTQVRGILPQEARHTDTPCLLCAPVDSEPDLSLIRSLILSCANQWRSRLIPYPGLSKAVPPSLLLAEKVPHLLRLAIRAVQEGPDALTCSSAPTMPRVFASSARCCRRALPPQGPRSLRSAGSS